MMKRNILAVVTPALLVAGAANATEIYKKDGNKLDLYGKIDARHKFSDNTNDDGDKAYVRFGFKGETHINHELIGYGQWEYNIQANNTEDDLDSLSGNKTRLGFAGLKFGDAGSLDYGRNYGIIYDAMSYTDQLPIFGDDSLYQGEDNFMIGRSSGLATYRNRNFFGLVQGLDFALQYQGKNEGKRKREFQNGDGWGASMSYNTGIGISVVGSYASSNRTNAQIADGTGDKADVYGTGIKYDDNNVYLAAFYGESHNTTNYGAIDVTAGNIAANKTQNIEVVAQYQLDFGLRPSIAYIQSKGKKLAGFTSNKGTFNGGDADLVKYIELGTYYYFNKNMSTYVDYKINLLDNNNYTRAAKRNTDDTVGVGILYQF